MDTSESGSASRILVVEDHDDVRRLLVTALELENHEVDSAANALDGLKRLEQRHYDLVLTDYSMPGETGAWMLREATSRGLMAGAAALIMTAHPDVRAVTNVEVVIKPFDLDDFLAQVSRLLATRRPVERPATARTIAHPRPASDVPVELVLYVNSESAASLEAARNLEKVAARFDPSSLKLTIHDLAREPLAADEDAIGFTPTLVKRSPEPRMWVMGNLRDPDILEDLLRVCGVRR